MDARKQVILRSLADKNLVPTTSWLDSFIDQTKDQANITALQQTARFRLLATDLTVSVQRLFVFPPNTADPGVAEKRLAGPVLTQLIDLEDIGTSVWSQIEAIEAHERGETTRGNQIIRAERDEDGELNTGPPPKSRGPHKLLLEDAAGTKVYAFEMTPINGIEIGCSMGMKLLLKDVTVARGVIMLRPDNVTVLGGKIEAHDRAWQTGRKQRLQRKIAQND